MNNFQNIPDHLFEKIVLFNSHPIADLVKKSVLFKYYKLQNEATHGCPFDRGGADAYYHRCPEPHYWTNGNGRDGGTVSELTNLEIDAYLLGYFGTKIRKDGDDLEASLHSLLTGEKGHGIQRRVPEN